MFDHLLGDELRRVIDAQRGPRPRAFQARYQKRGGGVAWSLRLVAVGFTAVALTAGGAAYAAAAGTGRAEPLKWAQNIQQTVNSFGQRHGWGKGAAPAGGTDGAGQPLPAPQVGRPVPAGTLPESQSASRGSRPKSTPSPSASPDATSQPSPAASSGPLHSGGSGRTDRHKRPGG